MKKFITISIACFLAVLGLNAQIVPEELPFKVSTNTTDGAVWYIIVTNNNTAAGKPNLPWDASINGFGGTPSIKWGWTETDTSDSLQYCFMGDNTNGFQVYSKIYLKGKTVPAYVLNSNGNGVILAPKTLDITKGDAGMVTLTEDIPLRNLNAFTGSAATPPPNVFGFSDVMPTTGTLLDKFFIWQGDGTTVFGDGKTVPTDRCKVFTLDYNIDDETTRNQVANQVHWNTSGGSTLSYTKNNPNTGVYSYQFIYVSGPEVGPNSVSQIETGQVSVYANNGVISVTGAQGAITLTSLPGISKKINAQAGVTNIPVDVSGIYIVSANGKSYKVLVP